MIAGRRLIRISIAGSSALVLLGGAAACSISSATQEAAQDAGYRSGDGILHLVPEEERDKPVELAGATTRGKTWDSADHRGEVVVVNLWASWCGPCAKEVICTASSPEGTNGGERHNIVPREYPTLVMDGALRSAHAISGRTS